MRIEKILTYPVKALRAVELDSAEVTKHGFPHDRRFMLLQVQKAKDNGPSTYRNMHIADFPQGVLIHPSLDLIKGLMTLEYKPPPHQDQEQEAQKSITFPLRPSTDNLSIIDVEMHKSPTKAYRMPQEYNDRLSQCYGFEVILAYLGANFRPVLMSTSHNKQTPSTSNSWFSTATSYLLGTTTAPEEQSITFADCAPYLIASSTSLQDLHPRLGPGEEADMLKFRPNIIVSGAEKPWDEDFWGEIIISPSSLDERVKITCVHNCGRCKSVNIDYETGKPGKGPQGEMLKKMQRDRRVDPGMKYSPIFGRYSFLGPGSEGKTIRVGDEVVVSRKLDDRTVFDWPSLATT